MSLVIAAGTWDGQSVRLDEQALFHLRLRLAGFGDGERVAIRVESEPEAKRYHQLQWYWGYIVKQLCETGDSERWWNEHLIVQCGSPTRELWDDHLRSECMPPNVATLSAMTYEQMDAYNLRCEQYAAEVVGIVIQGPDEARQFAAA